MSETTTAGRRGYLIDMDGVLYRGTDAIPGAAAFIRRLRERGVPFRLLTNNSQRTRRDVAAKLARMGIGVEDEHVFTSAEATARFLAGRRPGGTAFVIGEGGQQPALHQQRRGGPRPRLRGGRGGPAFNLELVEAAVRVVAGGAKLVATNPDPNCPTQDGGIRSGCGALVAMLEAATGVRAFSVGKPSPVMMRAARKELGLTTGETVMVGDTMETDILGGVQLGFHTVLVLSGGTRREDLGRYAYGPDVVVESVAALAERLGGAD